VPSSWVFDGFSATDVYLMGINWPLGSHSKAFFKSLADGFWQGLVTCKGLRMILGGLGQVSFHISSVIGLYQDAVC
jgi:hypothetical protein